MFSGPSVWASNCLSTKVKITNFPHSILAFLYTGSFTRMSEKQRPLTLSPLLSIIRISWRTWPQLGFVGQIPPPTAHPPSASPHTHLHSDPDKAAAGHLPSSAMQNACKHQCPHPCWAPMSAVRFLGRESPFSGLCPCRLPLGNVRLCSNFPTSLARVLQPFPKQFQIHNGSDQTVLLQYPPPPHPHSHQPWDSACEQSNLAKGRGEETDRSCKHTHTRACTHRNILFSDNTGACQRETVLKKIPCLASPFWSGWNSLPTDPDFLSLLHSAFTPGSQLLSVYLGLGRRLKISVALGEAAGSHTQPGPTLKPTPNPLPGEHQPVP